MSKQFNFSVAFKTKKKKQNRPKVLVYLDELTNRKDYNVFLKSKYWKYIRKKVLIRDKHKCIVCGSNKDLQVHHTTYKHHFAEHKHYDDLQTLCDKCHYLVHCTMEIK